MSVMQITDPEEIRTHIWNQNEEGVRSLVDELRKSGGTAAGLGLLPEVAEHCEPAAGARLVYLLVLAGADPAERGGRGLSALRAAVRRGAVPLVRALLQCGADPLEEQGGRSVLDEAGQCAELSALMEQFRPGLWEAVSGERLGDVRRLLNLWCLTSLSREGVTLRQLALETGNEAIISLILNIDPTMRSAFRVLAGDETGLAQLLASPAGRKMNPNFRKQSERGAPLLYFAARSGSVALCRLLVEQGATIGLHMRDEDGADMPLIFALLHPSISPEVITCLLPPAVGSSSSPGARQDRQLLLAACYGGRNVLTHAVETGLSSEVVGTLLQAAGPELVCERGVDNLCLAERLRGRPPLAALLRRTLADWLVRAPGDELVPLLVRGCDWLEPLLAGDGQLEPLLTKDGQLEFLLGEDGQLEPLLAGDGPLELKPAGDDQFELKPAGNGRQDPLPTLEPLPPEPRLAGDGQPEPPLAEDGPADGRVASFLRRRRAVQSRVDALERCLRRWDDHHRLEFGRLADQLPDGWLWHARPSGDGTPLLVLAALLGRPAAVARLGRGLPAPDAVRDGFRRTALHYASGAAGGETRRGLLRAGASDHTLDVNGREPLDFRDVADSKCMEELLRMRRDREYGRPEPDPWEPGRLRALHERRRRQRFLEPALRPAAGHGHSHWPGPPRAAAGWPPAFRPPPLATPAGAGGSASCVVS